MQQNKFGELIFAETDIMDLVMQGRDTESLVNLIVDKSVDLGRLLEYVDQPGKLSSWQQTTDQNMSTDEFHAKQQCHWHMPAEYQTLDIAAHVLSLCKSEAELQRCGQELLLYQERELFNLLRYLKYLVDVMTKNHVIWGVGRGSSVASFVLYQLGLHQIDSLYYNLDPREFLR
jgi:hypothetical protein